MPAKITTDLSKLGIPSWINAMPSYIQIGNTLGIKWAGGFMSNTEKNIPYIRATIFISNPENGDLIAVIDGDWISSIRTGAQTAVAARYLAINKPKVVALVGAGSQAYANALCLDNEFELEQIRIFDIDKNQVQKFTENAANDINT